jgi:hypothetical protein
MNTVIYRLNGTEASIHGVTRMDYDTVKRGNVMIHSSQDGAHEIASADIIRIH